MANNQAKDGAKMNLNEVDFLIRARYDFLLKFCLILILSVLIKQINVFKFSAASFFELQLPHCNRIDS